MVPLNPQPYKSLWYPCRTLKGAPSGSGVHGPLRIQKGLGASGSEEPLLCRDLAVSEKLGLPSSGVRILLFGVLS